jgi:nucleolar GTP-binding protein
MKTNPKLVKMYKLPTVLFHDEIMDKAFHKASKVPENDRIRSRLKRKKQHVTAKIDSVGDVVTSTLGNYVSSFPSLNQVHKFEAELIDLVVGSDKLKKSLGAVDWARKSIRSLHKEALKRVKNVRYDKDYSDLEAARRMFYGRVTSVLEQIANELKFLNSAREKLKRLPKIDPELTTIVVAGYPNVGKSLFVKNISSGKPTVAMYPFTTTQLNLGHMQIDNQRIQIIDTPGLLDHSFDKRNAIEHQAIMALRYLANLIIFILDPSEYCGYTLEDQYKLLEDIRKLFPEVKLLLIENKVDVLQSDSDNIKISALNKQGLDDVLMIIEDSV